MLSESDVDADLIRQRRIAIIGYGNQGRAHALNLRDSGCEIRAGARPGGAGWERAVQDGIDVQSIEQVAAWADLVSILVPDQYHREVFTHRIAPSLQIGDLLLVAHGFSILYGEIRPPNGVDVALVAPVGPGEMLRTLFLQGSGIPAVLAVHQDSSGLAGEIALSYAGALGCARVGVQRSTFAEETVTDLFGEQAILCGGLPALALAGFDTLVDAGYQPELAYLECIHQLKLIVDLIYARGIPGMRDAISDTARFGAYRAAPTVVDDHVRQSLQSVLKRIQDGTFAREWIAEARSGAPAMHEQQARERQSQAERIGAGLRGLMRSTDL
ncbi:MAG: ketol-acid reductoisomerase [Chloroflexota bacterium]